MLNVKLIQSFRFHLRILYHYTTLHTHTHTHTITGDDVTVLGYGSQLQILRQACDMAKEELGVSCELIDLRMILPWDEDTVIQVHVFILCFIQL